MVTSVQFFAFNFLIIFLKCTLTVPSDKPNL